MDNTPASIAIMILTVGGLLCSGVGAAGIVTALVGRPDRPAPESRAWVIAVAMGVVLSAGIASGMLSPAAALPVFLLTIAGTCGLALGLSVRSRKVAPERAAAAWDADGQDQVRRAA